jgi:tRNA (cytidine/uridine-2'-O-)-methyltransferase
VPPLHVVLVAPEIPSNTGNVGRTCVAAGLRLHLVRPLGFSLADRDVRRAGLDYWRDLDLVVHEDWDACLEALRGARRWYLTPGGRHRHTEVAYALGDALVFGRESTGLPHRLLEAEPEATLRIPMRPGYRSLNLANAVALVVYEALRQLGFPGLA